VVWSDELRGLAAEIVRAGALGRAHLALDYFDASLNRVGAWVIGARAACKAVLFALLEPTGRLREMEAAGDGFGCLALMEEVKALPFGAVWDAWCLEKGVPEGGRWIETIRDYEEAVLKKRS
ncbi:L-rhamnose isomerase, partial [Thermodesulfobacteriota bacterium]